MEQQSSTTLKPDRGWRVWWQLTRPHTLTAAFIPVFIGTALSLKQGSIHWSLFLSMLLACLFIQIATNLFNEYYDFVRGLDTEESVGIGGAIVRNGVKPKTVLNLAFTLLSLAALLGIYISATSTWWIAFIGLISMSAGYFYTGGPHPIAYTPFGEIVSGFFMGFVIILISFYIQTGTVSTTSVLVSIPISILVGSILLANNIRDLDGDKINGRKTLAILVGRNKAIGVLAAMFITSYLFVLLLVLMGVSSPFLLLTFLSIPKAIKATKGFIGKTMPIQMLPAMKATAQTTTIFGFLMSIGIFISYLMH